MHKAHLRLQDVSLGYQGRAVLEQVSFAIERFWLESQLVAKMKLLQNFP